MTHDNESSEQAAHDSQEPTQGRESSAEEAARLERLLSDAAAFYHRQLLDAKDGNLGDKYLLDKRIHRRLIKEHKIGLAGRGGLKQYLLSKKHSLEDCLKYGLVRKSAGDIVDVFRDALIFPVLKQGKAVYLVARQLAPGAKPKYLNIKRAVRWLYNEDVLTRTQRVIIGEGIPDTLALIQHGYPAVGTLGAGLFKEEFLPKFAAVPERYVCFDTDPAGVRGMGKVAALFNGLVKVIALPTGIKDVSDFFQQHTAQAFDALLKRAKWFVNDALDRVPATEIHLTDIEASKYILNRVKIQLRAAGRGDVCFVPTRFRAQYRVGEDIIRSQEFIIPQNDVILIKMCRESLDAQCGDLARFATEHLPPDCHVIQVEPLDCISVTQVLAFPKIKELQVGASGALITEEGREYRKQVAYFQGEKAASAKLYEAIGYVVADPRTAEARLLVSDCVEIREAFEEFQLTPAILQQFEAFRWKEGTSIDDYLNELAESAAYHFIGIFGDARKDAIIANLLCYHSPLYFYVEDELVNGWLQIACIGDTTTGKSQIAKRIRNYIDVGVYVTGETCSRTGFLYAIDMKTFATPTLTWGVLPQQDRSILIIDGSNYIDQKELGMAREARRSGKLIVQRVASGEHPCRTRLIFAANPPKPLNQYTYPIEALKDICQEPDIARIDLCLCFSGADVSKEEINQPHADRLCPAMAMDAETLRHSVFWAWSRKPEDIVFSPEVVAELNAVANRLLEQFGAASDIPLVSNDIRLKVEKMSLAFASLLHSTDATHTKILPTCEIVKAAERFLVRVYSASNCRLNQYAADRQSSTDITNEEFARIQGALRDEQQRDRSNSLTELIELFRTNNAIHLNELSARLDRSTSTIKEKLVFFRRFGLIRSGKSGYAKTEKFIQFLNRLQREQASLSTPAASASTPPSIVPTTGDPASDPTGHEPVQPGNGKDAVQKTARPLSPEQLILDRIREREHQRRAEGHGTSDAERQN